MKFVLFFLSAALALLFVMLYRTTKTEEEITDEKLLKSQYKASLKREKFDITVRASRHVCDWKHIWGGDDSESIMICNRCDYTETFRPFYNGKTFDVLGISDATYEHFIKCHEELLNEWVEMAREIPGSRVIFTANKLGKIDLHYGGVT